MEAEACVLPDEGYYKYIRRFEITPEMRSLFYTDSTDKADEALDFETTGELWNALFIILEERRSWLLTDSMMTLDIPPPDMSHCTQETQDRFWSQRIPADIESVDMLQWPATSEYLARIPDWLELRYGDGLKLLI